MAKRIHTHRMGTAVYLGGVDPGALDAAAADAVAASPAIARVDPGTAGTPGKALIQGPSSPTFADMETVIFDHVFERSATPATNRANLQTLLDRVKPTGTGKQVRVFIPPKFDGSGNPDPLVVDRRTTDAWALDVPSDVVIEGTGRGSSLRLAGSQPNSSRIIRVQGKSNVVIRNLRIDGNRANNNLTYEHSHCIFVYDSSDVLIEDVETFDATGDGVSVSGTVAKSRRVWLNRVRSTGHKRNPVTVEQVDDAWITNSYLICAADSTGQAIDSEPFENVVTSGLVIQNNILGHLDPTRYVLTLGGKDATYPRSNTVVIGNEFRNGTIKTTAAEDLVLSGNTGIVDRVDALGYGKRVVMSGNVFEVVTATNYGFNIGASLGSAPDSWLLTDNVILAPNGGGAYKIAGANNITVRGGRIYGNNAAGLYGVHVSGTANMENISVTGLQIENFNAPFRASPSGAFTLSGLKVGDFIINGSGSGLAAIDLYSASSWMTNIVVLPSVVRNAATSPFTIHTGTPFVTAGTPGYGATWNCYGTPEGVITERVGAMAVRRDGGASTTLYVKESGTGNTGWRAV